MSVWFSLRNKTTKARNLFIWLNILIQWNREITSEKEEWEERRQTGKVFFFFGLKFIARNIPHSKRLSNSNPRDILPFSLKWFAGIQANSIYYYSCCWIISIKKRTARITYTTSVVPTVQLTFRRIGILFVQQSRHIIANC